MSDTTTIAMRLQDGYLAFDRTVLNRYDENLASWLDNVAPEDLFLGDFCFEVPVRIDWEGHDGGPIL